MGKILRNLSKEKALQSVSEKYLNEKTKKKCGG